MLRFDFSHRQSGGANPAAVLSPYHSTVTKLVSFAARVRITNLPINIHMHEPVARYNAQAVVEGTGSFSTPCLRDVLRRQQAGKRQVETRETPPQDEFNENLHCPYWLHPHGLRGQGSEMLGH